MIKKLLRLLIWTLLPLSILYGLVQWMRRQLYRRSLIDQYKLPGITISVGNLEVGGTGKTPVVIALADSLTKDGFRPVILTRGYQSGLKVDESAVLLAGQTLMPPQSTRRFYADEARLQSQTLPHVPVIIGVDRIAASRRYLESFPEPTHWLLEDGFQHLKIARDIDILLLDWQAPFDNHLVVPCGRLREFVATAKFADKIVFTRVQERTVPSGVPKGVPYYWSRFKIGDLKLRSKGVKDQTDLPDFLVTGIAKPYKLLEQLAANRFSIKTRYLLNDHQPIDRSRLIAKSQGHLGIITTEKDYFRDPEVFSDLSIPCYTIGLNASIEDLYNSLKLR